MDILPFALRLVHTHISIWYHCGEPLTGTAVTNSTFVVNAVGDVFLAVGNAAAALKRAAGKANDAAAPERAAEQARPAAAQAF